MFRLGIDSELELKINRLINFYTLKYEHLKLDTKSLNQFIEKYKIYPEYTPRGIVHDKADVWLIYSINKNYYILVIDTKTNNICNWMFSVYGSIQDAYNYILFDEIILRHYKRKKNYISCYNNKIRDYIK